MNQFQSFVIKETKHILRDKRTMLILFGIPIVLMLIFGFAITTDVKNVRVAVVTSTADHLTRQVVDRLSASEYFTIVSTVSTPREAERMIRYQKADLAMVFSQNFASDRTGVQFIVDGADPNMAQQWIIYAQQTVSPSFHSSVSSLFYLKMLYNPRMQSVYNFVPAIMGMLLMLVCTLMTSISIVREKERGTMEVLLVSPFRPLLIIVAKTIPYLVLSFVILIVILLMAKFALGVPLEGSLFWIFFLSTVYILLALSLGMLISNVAHTQLAALLISAMVLLMPVVMFSGMLFPVESMPEILQWVSALIPPRYYIDAMRKLMIMGVGVEQVLRELLILVGMLLLLLLLALKTFKKRLT
jgi:ABC-2 type transport system permease protein